MSDAAAAAYSERHGPHAIAIVRDGRRSLERASDGWDPAAPHAIYSGTKSFWGIAAAAAAEDGLLALDEPVAATIPAFADDARKRALLVRHLLNLTSGYAFGGMGAAVPVAEKALTLPLVAEPGTTFTYGGVPLQVFGEVLRRKLRGGSPHAYLRERVLDPAGVRIARWRDLADGTQPLPTGAFLALPAWLRYGALLLGRGTIDGTRIVAPASFDAVAAGSTVNPRYGLGLWRETLRDGSPVLYASGAGGQALYTIAALGVVAARFGRGKSWNHAAFLRALTAT